MKHDLFIGDRLFSSWSMRGWLMLRKFSIPHNTHMVGLYSGTMPQDLTALAPARLVPTLRTGDGIVVGESLAMAETLAELHPDCGMWPKNAKSRATARWLCAEMVAGFSALRGDCPMQLSHVWKGFDADKLVRNDLRRIEELWAHARAISGASEGYLFGDYSLADVFYTPLAARIIGYDLPVSLANRDYCLHLLSDVNVRQWRAMGLTVTYTPFPYPHDLPTAAWPISSEKSPRPIETGPSENLTCPYSGDPVTHFLKLDGRVWGFCNAFCRDKTVADTDAWPKFLEMISDS
ncbi:MAG: glutathione S-transferase [Paracoccaceae bacterium]